MVCLDPLTCQVGGMLIQVAENINTHNKVYVCHICDMLCLILMDKSPLYCSSSMGGEILNVLLLRASAT